MTEAFPLLPLPRMVQPNARDLPDGEFEEDEVGAGFMGGGNVGKE
jgi:hypothetical protein